MEHEYIFSGGHGFTLEHGGDDDIWLQVGPRPDERFPRSLLNRSDILALVHSLLKSLGDMDLYKEEEISL